MRCVFPTMLSLGVCLLTGCSLFRSSMQSISISATDPQAMLFADGQPVGQGAANISLKRNETHTFLAKTEDGRAGTAQVGRSMSSTAMLDIVGGIFLLVPFFGLLGPGAWDLDATNIVIIVPAK